ncbi:MAG: tetratricopeptide repeat protein [Fusobacteriaceae bacterium]
MDKNYLDLEKKYNDLKKEFEQTLKFVHTGAEKRFLAFQIILVIFGFFLTMAVLTVGYDVLKFKYQREKEFASIEKKVIISKIDVEIKIADTKNEEEKINILENILNNDEYKKDLDEEYKKKIYFEIATSKIYGNGSNGFKKIVKYSSEFLKFSDSSDDQKILVYLGRAKALEGQEKYFEAILDYTEILKLRQNNFQYYVGRAKNYYELKKYDEAILDYKQASLLSPETIESDIAIGNIYEKNNKNNEAIFVYTVAINKVEELLNSKKIDKKINFDFTKPYEKTAGIYKRSKKYNEAIKCYNSLLNILETFENNITDAPIFLFYTNKSFFFRERGLLKEKIKDYKGAIDDYTKYIKINSEDYIGYELRGNIYFKIGKKKLANQDFKKFKELKEKFLRKKTMFDDNDAVLVFTSNGKRFYKNINKNQLE